MKRAFSLSVALLFLVAFISFAFAGEMKKGSIRGIDVEKGTIVFCPEGTTDRVDMPVDKSVDLKKIKSETKVEISVEKKNGKEIVKEIKVIRPRKAIEGC